MSAVQKLVGRVRRSADRDAIAADKLPATSGFSLSIHLHATILDKKLRLPSRFRDANELQQLVQAQRFVFVGGIGCHDDTSVSRDTGKEPGWPKSSQRGNQKRHGVDEVGEPKTELSGFGVR